MTDLTIDDSLPCFKNFTSYELNETVEEIQLLHAGSSPFLLISSVLSIPLNSLIVFVIVTQKTKPEGAVHMLLLAIADMLFVTTPWLMYFLLIGARAGSYCHLTWYWRAYEYVSTVTITQNRWMTFFMAFKRFLCLFWFKFALHIKDKTKRQNYVDNILWSFVCGLAQGILLSAFMYYDDVNTQSRWVHYIVHNVHSTVLTAAMAIATILMIARITCFPECGFRIQEGSRTTIEFRRAIIGVAIFYVLAQTTTIAYFYKRQVNADKYIVENFRARWIFLTLNSSVNLFIYCVVSRTFRKRLWKLIVRSKKQMKLASSNATSQNTTQL